MADQLKSSLLHFSELYVTSTKFVTSLYSTTGSTQFTCVCKKKRLPVSVGPSSITTGCRIKHEKVFLGRFEIIDCEIFRSLSQFLLFFAHTKLI